MTEREQFEKVRSALEEYTQIPFMSSMGESLNQCCRTLASEGHADGCRGNEALKILEAWQAARAASPKVPQGVEEWIESAQVQIGDESPAGWGNYIPSSEARSHLSGMAIVPVESISKALHGLEHLKADIQARSTLQEDYQDGVVMVGAGAWHGLCGAILMLAATKEKQS